MDAVYLKGGTPFPKIFSKRIVLSKLLPGGLVKGISG